MADNNLLIAGLDFAQIKENLKTYLKNNSDFTDYNFEGSGLTTLLNLLAYNTQYNAFYLNMMVNDAFLDTAVMRSSVLSHAKSLGYIPISAIGANATVDITVTSTIDTQALIESTDRFEAVVDGTSYPLYPDKTYSATKVDIGGGDFTYTFTDVKLNQGTPLQKRFTVSSSGTQKFILTNSNIDSNTISVEIFDSAGSSSSSIYINSTEIIELTSASEVYFLQENVDGSIEIYFGDDIIGKKPLKNNVILVNYKVSAGDVVNGVQSIELTSGFAIDELGISAAVVNGGLTVTESVNGGSFAESTDSIKLKAPRNYSGQNRAVTEDDYTFFVKQIYPNVDAVSVWGGQDNDPPFYGQVFLSIKPIGDVVLDAITKADIIANLQKRNIITIVPQIVDPEYLYIIFDSIVKYDSTKVAAGVSIESLSRAKIKEFVDTEINDFNKTFRYSKLLKEIDNNHDAIVSNLTSVKLKRSFIPSATPAILTRSLFFVNPLVPGSITSNTFTITDDSIPLELNNNLFFDDDLNGKLRIAKYNEEGEKIILKDSGSVDYASGTVIIAEVQFNTITGGTTLKIVATPNANDIFSSRNVIATVLDADILVEGVVEVE